MKKLISIICAVVLSIAMFGCTPVSDSSNSSNNSTIEPPVNTPTTYEVSFEVDGEVYHSETVEEGEKLTKPADPEKEPSGSTVYEFDGWYFAEAAWDFENGVVECDMVLTAHWLSEDYYSVEFYNGETLVSSTTVKAYNPVALPETTPTKASDDMYDYAFDKWVAEDGSAVDLSAVSGNLKVYAQFNKNLNKKGLDTLLLFNTAESLSIVTRAMDWKNELKFVEDENAVGGYAIEDIVYWNGTTGNKYGTKIDLKSLYTVGEIHSIVITYAFIKDGFGWGRTSFNLNKLVDISANVTNAFDLGYSGSPVNSAYRTKTISQQDLLGLGMLEADTLDYVMIDPYGQKQERTMRIASIEIITVEEAAAQN